SAPLKSLHGSAFRHLIAVSGFIRQEMVEKFGIAAERIRVIHNGVDPARLVAPSSMQAAHFRASHEIGDEVVFSVLARITRAKGHYDLIEALRLLPSALNYKCLIVGE